MNTRVAPQWSKSAATRAAAPASTQLPMKKGAATAIRWAFPVALTQKRYHGRQRLDKRAIRLLASLKADWGEEVRRPSLTPR